MPSPAASGSASCTWSGATSSGRSWWPPQVLREEPCHEPVARRLMVAYARLGQPQMALRQYERIVEVLDPEPAWRPPPRRSTWDDPGGEV